MNRFIFNTFLFLCLISGLFGDINRDDASSLAIFEGEQTVAIDKRLEIVTGPYNELLKPKCVSGDCEVTIDSRVDSINNAQVIVYYKVKFYHILPEICCSINTCLFKKIPLPASHSDHCSSNGNTFYPQFNAEGISMSLSTDFMEDHHFVELRQNDHTVVNLPAAHVSSMYLYGAIQHTNHQIKCQLFINETEVDFSNYINQYRNIQWIKIKIPTSDTYSYLVDFNCTSDINNNFTVNVYRRKTITVNVKQDPSIIFPDNLTFPVNDASQRIKLEVLSTDDIESITITKNRILQNSYITINTLPTSPSSIIQQYLVIFYGIKFSSTGIYNITIVTKKNILRWKLFEIFTIQKPIVNIYPIQLIRLKGQSAEFTCLAHGSNIKEVLWKRNGITQTSKMIVTMNNLTHTSYHVKVMMVYVEHSDSGEYFCSALSVTGSRNIKYINLLVRTK